jgi:hypothetical protein
MSMFLDYLRPKLQQFIKHNFVMRWQDTQCRLAMVNLPCDCILSHIDFVENYSFQIHNGSNQCIGTHSKSQH